MKRFTLALAATLLSTTAAIAASDIGTFDVNGDGFASVAEVDAVFPGFSRSDFRQIDGNRDNRISRSELRQPGVSAIVGRYLGGAGQIVALSEIDTSGSGFASFAELSATYPGLTAIEFDRIDSNGDNRVSFGELYDPIAQTLVSLHEATDSQVSLLSQVDTNGDSFAGFGELVSAYPGLTPADLNQIDSNDDNRLSRAEFRSLETQTVLRRVGS